MRISSLPRCAPPAAARWLAFFILGFAACTSPQHLDEPTSDGGFDLATPDGLSGDDLASHRDLANDDLADGSQSVTLTVATDGSGSGAVTASPGSIDCVSGSAASCSETVPAGEQVTLTATAATGSQLTAWSGACAGSAVTTCQVQVSESLTVSAQFSAIAEALDVTITGTGTGVVFGGNPPPDNPYPLYCVSSGDPLPPGQPEYCSPSFDYGTSLTLTAQPDNGMQFAAWGGACSGTSSTCTISMNQVQNVSAQFTPQAGGGPQVPTTFRVDVSYGTTGQLFLTWDKMNGSTYYNLQRSANGGAYALVGACSGAGTKYAQSSGSIICRDPGLTPGTTYSYEVQSCNGSDCSAFTSPVANIPASSNCTNGASGQIPDLSGIKAPPATGILTSTIDSQTQFMSTANEYFAYPSTGVAHRNLLVVDLPGSGGQCGGGGTFGDIAGELGYDYICVNYPNVSEQNSICTGNPACYGNVSQAKLDATGPCSTPGDAVDCGKDPHTKAPFYNSNPHDGVTMRVTTMLQYLVNNGYNKNGTDWSQYLDGSAPSWGKLVIGGFSQGGDMGSFAAYHYSVARVHMLSSPPTATLVNGVETAATYFTALTKVTSIRNFYGLVSENDAHYPSGDYAAVWLALGFTASNDDAEEKLSSSNGIDCSGSAPSHNFSTDFLVSPAGGHPDTLYPWNEDVYKFMLNM